MSFQHPVATSACAKVTIVKSASASSSPLDSNDMFHVVSKQTNIKCRHKQPVNFIGASKPRNNAPSRYCQLHFGCFG